MKSPIVILFVTGLFFCQAKAELRQSYDLESLIQITEKNHIQIKKADSKILEMAKEVQLSNARFFPEVSLQSTQSTNQLLLKQNIYDGGATIASSDISTENKSLSEWDRKKQFKNLKELVTETYYHGLLIRQHKLLLESNSKLCENALEYAQKQMKFRSIGRDTLLRAKVEYRKSRAALFEVKRSERLVSQLLSKLTRLRDFELENLKGDLAFKDIEPPFEKKLLKLAELNHESSADIQSLISKQRLLNAQKDLDLAEDRLNLSYTLTYGFSKNETSIGTNYVFEPGFKHTVLLNIPLWSGWSSNAKKGIFKQRQEQLGLDLENTRSEYTSEMEEKIENLNKDWQELHSIEEEIALSDEIWREVNKSYFIGLSSPELWFESLNTLQTWKIRQLSKLKDYSVSFNQILGDVGRMDQ